MEQPTRRVRKSVFIGLGGTGNEIVRRVKREMLSHNYRSPLFQYLVLDTVTFDETPGIDENMRLRNGEEYLYIGGYNPNEVLKNLDNWPVIRRWWGNRRQSSLVTVDEGAGQMRSVGRMSFFYNFHTIEAQFKRIVNEITSANNREHARARNYEVSGNSPIIYVVFSLCGGTGSSLFFDVAYVMRHLLRFTEKPIVVGIALMPGAYLDQINSRPQKTRIQANAYAALMEIERLHNMALGEEPRPDGKNLWNVPYSTNFRVDSPELPFDYIYLVDNITTKGDSYDIERVYETVSRTVFWLSGPPTAAKFWERAKNLSSKTLASGGRSDTSGQKRFSGYSSFGSSTLKYDWSITRVRAKLENMLIETLRHATPARIAFPEWLTSVTSLYETFITEQPSIIRYPKKLDPSGTQNSEAVVNERIEECKNTYEFELNSILSALPWQRSRNKYRAELAEFIKTTLYSILCTQGPIAAYRATEDIRTRLTDLIDEAREQAQSYNQKVSTFNEQYEQGFREPRIASPFEQIMGALWESLTRIYILQAFRRQATPEQLKEIVERKTSQLHTWYMDRLRALLYKEFMETILKPALVYLDELKSVLEGVDENLQTLQKRNDETLRHRTRKTPTVAIDMIRPYRDELAQIDEAIKSDRLRIDVSMGDMLHSTFEDWPPVGTRIYPMLENAISETTTEMLRSLSNIEHIMERVIVRDDAEVVKQRMTFLQGAECLWNITSDTDQEMPAHIEAIDLFGFGAADTYQNISTSDLADLARNELFQNQATKPECISTDITHELGYIKTSHGVLISSIRYIAQLQRAYHEMDKLRNAPYLHIDYADNVREGYGPLVSSNKTYREIIDEWTEAVNMLWNMLRREAEEIRRLVENYRTQVIQQATQSDRQITPERTLDDLLIIRDALDAIFDFVLALEEIVIKLPQIPGVAEVLLKLVDLDIILYSQGWREFAPQPGTLFDQAHHIVHQYIPQSNYNTPGRIVNVKYHGYQRRLRDKKKDQYEYRYQIRKAVVDVSQ